jgi:hypothetical protein
LEALREVFGDRIISRGLLSKCSHDLIHRDLYLWGSLKNKVNKTDPHTLEKQRNNIRREISEIFREEIQRVDTNVFRRYTECIRSGGQHFQHLLCALVSFYYRQHFASLLTSDVDDADRQYGTPISQVSRSMRATTMCGIWRETVH